MSGGQVLGPLHRSVTRARSLYEELTGLSKVFQSQEQVEMVKRELLSWRSDLKNERQSLHKVQEQIQDARNKLDGVSRTDERFLALATREHELLKQEKECSEKCRVLERREREEFATLYEAVSESHGQERAYANRTKYWSVIGSVTGTLIGVIGSSLLKWRRNAQIREAIQEHSDGIKLDGKEQVKAMELLMNQQREEAVSRMCSVEKDISFVRVELTKQSDLLGQVTEGSHFGSSLESDNGGTSPERVVCGMVFCVLLGVVLSKVTGFS